MSKEFDPHRPFKFAEIYSAGGDVSKPWYVYFFYSVPGSDPVRWKMFKKTFGINRIKNSKKRLKEAKEIQQTINKSLLDGFNPFGKNEGLNDSVNRCVERYMHDHVSKLRPRTQSSLKSAMKVLCEKFGKHRINEVSGSILKNYLVDLSRGRKWENKTYNGTLSYWKSFFNYYKKHDPPLIDKNPCDSIGYLKVYPTDRNRPPNEDEFSRIVNHIYENDRPLFLYAMIIYYQGFRVTETGRLMRSHLEFEAEHPFFRLEAKLQKDNEDVIQYVSPHLLQYLYDAGIDKLPDNHYLFSTKLLPGNKLVKKIKDNVEERWKAVVKDGLGIHVDLYSLKHKQATELADHADEEEIMRYLRHSSIEVTRNYIKRHKPIVKFSFFENQRSLPLTKK